MDGHTGSQPNAPRNKEQEDLESASHSTADYSHFMPPVGKHSKHRSSKVLQSFAVIVIIGVLGIGGYLLLHKKPAKNNQQAPTTQQTTQSSDAITSATKNYQSTDFGLSFDYPADWTVTEAAGSNKIVVSSPGLSLTDTSGQRTTGQVLLTVDQKGNNLSMFDKGNAVAVLDSKKVSYTKPSSSQRAQTYISFLQYITTSASGALDGVYVTGDSGYQKGQAIPEVDIAKVDPLIRVTFMQCANSTCSGTTTPMSIAASEWSDTTFSRPIESMIESLVVQ